MLYVEAPNEIPEDAPHPIIYLAGGVRCVNWQQKVVDALQDCECTVLNPRRDHLPGQLDQPDYQNEQIAWQFQQLWQRTEIFTLWFSEGVNDSMLLYELGAHLARCRVSLDFQGSLPFAALVVGGDPHYEYRSAVEQEAAHALGRPCELHDTLEEHIQAIQKAVELYHETLENFEEVHERFGNRDVVAPDEDEVMDDDDDDFAEASERDEEEFENDECG